MIRLISLGSSFAAGPGIQPITSKPANRSAANYPSLLASLIPADEHIDVTYSGATLLNILNTPQNDAPPQIDAITATANPDDRCIVTMTAGGNDLGYVGGIMMDSLGASWLGWPLAYMMSRRLTPPPLDEQGLVDRFREVVRAVRQKEPKAEVVLVGYLTLLGDDVVAGESVALSASQIEKAKKKAEVLRMAYKRAAEEEKCGFVDVAERSKGHGVGSAEPWVIGSSWGYLWGGDVAWHPNRRGMEVVAGMVNEYLRG